MRRLILFVLLFVAIGAIGGLLVVGIPWIGVEMFEAPAATHYDYIVSVFNTIRAGNWPWQTINAMTIFTYGYALYLLINAVLLLSILIMALTTFFRFSRVYRFFGTIWWYLASAIIFTGVNVYLMIDAGGNILDYTQELPWQFFLPIASALVITAVGLVLKFTERKS